MKKRKIACKDFTEDDLPHNRKEVFFDCIKVRTALIFGMGALFVLFLIPYIAVNIYKDIMLLALQEKVNVEEYERMYLSINALFSVFDIISFLIMGIGVSGIINVQKKLIWGDPIFFWEDFFKGIKQNSAKCLLVFLLVGGIRSLLYFSFETINEIISVMSVMSVILSFVIILPVLLWIVMQTAFYTNTFLASLKNSLIFWMKTIPQSLLLTFVLLLPFVSFLIPYLFIKYLVFVVVGIFVFPLALMAWLLYSSSIFDEYINKISYPEFVDKGIYRKK